MAPNFMTMGTKKQSTMPPASSAATVMESASTHGNHGHRSASAPASLANGNARNHPSQHASTLSSPCLQRVVDRGLLQKYEEVSHELERMGRLSSQSCDLTHLDDHFHEMQKELKKMRRNSIAMIQSQKDILEKMDRTERSSLRRFFTMNREQKMEKLKVKLCEKLSESVVFDQELERLERKSGTILGEMRRTTGFYNTQFFQGHPVSSLGSVGSMGSMPTISDQDDEEDWAWKMETLERERQDLLENLCSAINSPDVNQVHTRIAMYASEVKACESIGKQVEKCSQLYRQALQLLRFALTAIVSAEYKRTIKEFVNGPYPLTIEAGHLMEAASHVVQPESCRRYRQFAPELVHVRPPKFPQAIADFSRRARTHFDPNSAIALEGLRKLPSGEKVILLMQRMVLQKLEIIEQWRKQLEQDYERAERAHRQLETRLQEQMTVLARSLSV